MATVDKVSAAIAIVTWLAVAVRESQPFYELKAYKSKFDSYLQYRLM